ncbi:MAG: HAMP domain-containing histidine kinase [Candidatus Riflebacteria bacterium]|nr:HAMP domain-containing histidine kinase [Candidatus Riflebacteria bacterium]
MKHLSFLFRSILPASLFGRLFLSVLMVAVLVLALIWGWFYQRFYQSLDREADQRLQRIADALRIEISEAEDAEDRYSRAMQSFWQLEKSGGLIQNMYLLDMSAEPPAFIASHSLPGNRALSMLPPTAEEAEDLAFDYINELDRGEMVFPDPYAYGISRRFKIVLCPVLDELGMLASVIGIEADMEYLKLVSDFRRLLAETVLAALILSLLVAWLLARSFSRKITHLNQSLEAVELEQCPKHQPMGVNELDLLGRGIEKLSHEIARQRLQVQRLYEQKLDELAFTGGAIAHEIRNPLSAIEMHFGLLKRQLTGLAGTQADAAATALAEISGQLAHLRTLIENYLTYSRKVQPKSQRVDLKEFFDRLLTSRRAVLTDFACEIDFGSVTHAWFDPTLLQQVFENLINNSVQAAAGKPLQLKIAIELHGSQLTIRFADNGPGIAADLREKLFTPFVSGREGGSGFGLALIRKLVEAHGGEISYIGDEGGGAIFLIEVAQHEDSGGR